ncbi:MAG: methyltransferase [Planctomycetaceae bacterium]|nr:methyltransferase [Planctomycetaceae bacterium]
MQAHLYDELWNVEREHWWFVARRQIIGSLVDRYASAAKDERLDICELGCGTGGNLAQWAENHQIVGLDASEQALEYARQTVDVRVEYGRLPDQIPFPNASFDVVLMADVLEHVEEDAASVRAAMELLRVGGIFVATIPAHQWLISPRDVQHQHFRRYSKRGLRQVLNVSGTEIELLSYYNSVCFPIAVVARLWSKLPGLVNATGDLTVPAAPLNAFFTRVFASERHLLGRMPMPPGLSLVSVVRKRENATNRMAG